MLTRQTSDLGIDVDRGYRAAIANEPCQHGRVVAGAGADLEDPLTCSDIEKARHGDHDPDLAGGADRFPLRVLLGDDGVTAVDAFERDFRQECLARNAAKRVFDRSVELQAAPLQFVDHRATKLASARYRDGAHSHSIVAGGFDETS